MADYYSILQKTIAGLPNNTPEIRNAVYKKARTAIETQLRNMDPMPSEDAITSQLSLLEEAILLIDTENAPATVPLPPVEDIPEEVASATESMPITAPVAPTPPPESVTSAPEVPAPEVPQSPQPTQPAQPSVAETYTPPPAEMPPVPEQIAPVVPPAAAPSVVERVETALDKIDSDAPPTVGLDAPEPATASLDPSAVSVEPNTRDILDPILSSDAASGAVHMEENKSGGFLGGLVKWVVILGLLGGGGYAVWKNKDELSGLASSFMQPAETTEETTVPDPQPVEETSQNTNEPVEPEVAEPEVPVQQEEEVTQSEPETVVPEVDQPGTAEPETTTEPETQEQAQEEVPATTEQTEQSGIIPIGEVAYLYEEGTAGSGATRTNAGITWETRQESLAAGTPPESVIIGKMDVPEKGMTINIKIKRNIDEAVSASHMIEMSFDIPPDFAGKSIESIARFVMKSTEEAPGEPLAAVPVKVTEGNFLIALDNLAQAVTLNTQLLQNSSWIDVPIVYGTGKRALITLEKGGTGDLVFEEAFSDWQNR